MIHGSVQVGFTTYKYEVTPKKTIVIKKIRDGKIQDIFAYRVGDIAEYDSYNLHYFGTIESISAKTVTIQPRYAERKRRLKLDTFAWRNGNKSIDEKFSDNADTMMYI
jgi:hypothetical protein